MEPHDAQLAKQESPGSHDDAVEQPTVVGKPTDDGWRFQLRLAVAIALPVFLETLDYTVVATAQTHIASTFNRIDLQSYIGTAYVLTSTVFLPLFASLADIFGRHWAIQVSLLVFMIGSAISTAAQNMPMMLAGRGIAGIGAAGLLTVVRVMLADFRSLNANNWQATMIVVLYAIGFSVGPVIGGALSTISFRWVFAINLPCCALSIVLAFLLLHNRVVKSVPSKRSLARGVKETTFDKWCRIDIIGATLFIGGGILVLLGLNWGSTVAWNAARVIVTFVVGGLLLVFFVVWEYVLERQIHADNPGRIWRADPMIPLDVFMNYDVVATEFAAFSSGMVMLAIFYFVSVFFVIVVGSSATNAGVQLIFFAPGMGIGSILSVQLIKRLRQPKIPIVIGGLIIPVALGFLSMAMQHNRQVTVDGLMALTGVGVGMTFGPLAIQARFSQPEDRVAIVVSLNLFFRTLGGTVGIAQCSAVLFAKVRAYLTHLVVTGVIPPTEIEQLASSSLSSLHGIQALSPQLAQFVKDAYRNGTRWSFISLIPWTAIAFVLVLFLSPIADTDRERLEAEYGGKKPEQADNEAHGAAPPAADGGPALSADGQPALPADSEAAVPTSAQPARKAIKARGPVTLIARGVQKGVWAIQDSREKSKPASAPPPAEAA